MLSLHIDVFFLSVDILHKACISDQPRLVKTPLEHNVHYTPNNVPLNAPTLYYTIVGSLVYLIITWLDVSYIVHIVSLSLPLLLVIRGSYCLYFSVHLRDFISKRHLDTHYSIFFFFFMSMWSILRLIVILFIITCHLTLFLFLLFP